MRVYLAKHGNCLVGTDDESGTLIRRMGDGEIAVFDVLRPRSVQWHRMYYGICRSIGDNQDPPRDEDSIDNELRVRAGHFDVFFIGKSEIRVPKRIAFAKMGADEWAKLWMSLEVAIRETFGDEYLMESAL